MSATPLADNTFKIKSLPLCRPTITLVGSLAVVHRDEIMLSSSLRLHLRDSIQEEEVSHLSTWSTVFSDFFNNNEDSCLKPYMCTDFSVVATHRSSYPSRVCINVAHCTLGVIG